MTGTCRGVGAVQEGPGPHRPPVTAHKIFPEDGHPLGNQSGSDHALEPTNEGEQVCLGHGA